MKRKVCLKREYQNEKKTLHFFIDLEPHSQAVLPLGRGNDEEGPSVEVAFGSGQRREKCQKVQVRQIDLSVCSDHSHANKFGDERRREHR